MNDVYQRFVADKRFAMLSLVMRRTDAATRTFIADKGEPWPQVIVGPLSNALASAYGVEDDRVPTAILIGPDGKVMASARFAQVSDMLTKALRRREVIECVLVVLESGREPRPPRGLCSSSNRQGNAAKGGGEL